MNGANCFQSVNVRFMGTAGVIGHVASEIRAQLGQLFDAAAVARIERFLIDGDEDLFEPAQASAAPLIGIMTSSG